MKLLLVPTAQILDPGKFQNYVAGVVETLGFKGEIIAKGKAAASLKGTPDHHMLGVIRFPDMHALLKWH